MKIRVVEAVLLGIALAMDAFAVSVSTGIVLGKARWNQAAKVGLFFGVAQGIMPVIGYYLASTFSKYIQMAAPWIAFGLLLFLGGKMIFEAIREQDDCDELKNPLNTKTLFMLAVATSIDALAVGVTIAVVEGEIWISSLIIAVITFVISVAGVYLGRGVGSFAKTKAEVTGGAILILIGMKILLESFGIIKF